MRRPEAVLNALSTKLLIHIKKNIDGFEVVKKQESSLMRFLEKVLFFNKAFMKRYITTIYPKVYVPEERFHNIGSISYISTMAHEYVHLKDEKKMGLLFKFLYLSPQIFSLFALLSLWNPWFLLSLLFLLPWPSPGRMWLEFRGYRMSLAVHHWLDTADEQIFIDHYVTHFTSSNYYWMFPFKKFMLNKFHAELSKLQRDELASELFEIKIVLKEE